MAFLSFLRCAEGLQSCCIMHDVTSTPSEMADLMFDVLCVVAACSASRCTRLECVQRRAARALPELLMCARYGLHVVCNAAVLRVLLVIMQQSKLRVVGHTAYHLRVQ